MEAETVAFGYPRQCAVVNGERRPRSLKSRLRIFVPIWFARGGIFLKQGNRRVPEAVAYFEAPERLRVMSLNGTFRTWPDVRLESVNRLKADIPPQGRDFRF
jgi:hypothetical protein